MGEEEVTFDELLGGTLRLFQPRRGHRAGTDAVLLAGLAPVRPGDRVVDLGASTGAVGLMIGRREPSARILLVEREPPLVALAERNVATNAVAGRVIPIAADVFQRSTWPAELAGSVADLVVTNPPYLEPGPHSSPDPGRRAAHVMGGGDLPGWLAAAANILRERGRLCLIHRADAAPACFAALTPRFGSISLTPIHPKPGEGASRILLTALKGGRAPFRLDPPLVLHGPDGRFTPEAELLHRGRAPDERGVTEEVSPGSLGPIAPNPGA